MARPRGDDVKRHVALATFELIAARGVDGMSMRTIADITGLSTGTINYHFGSKRGVLLASIEYGYRLRPHDWVEGDPATNLRSLLRRYELTTDVRRTWWQFWLAAASFAQHDDEVAQIFCHQHRWVIDRFSMVLRDGVQREVFGPMADVEASAVKMVNLAHGQAVAQLVGQVPPEDVSAAFDAEVAECSAFQSDR